MTDPKAGSGRPSLYRFRLKTVRSQPVRVVCELPVFLRLSRRRVTDSLHPKIRIRLVDLIPSLQYARRPKNVLATSNFAGWFAKIPEINPETTAPRSYPGNSLSRLDTNDLFLPRFHISCLPEFRRRVDRGSRASYYSRPSPVKMLGYVPMHASQLSLYFARF